VKAYVVVGLGFGDEGKGAVVDALVRERKASLVVRYNGGAQAGHNVVDHDQDGGRRHHCFAQFLQHARPLYTLLDKKDAFGLDYARQAVEKLGVPLRGASFGRNVFQKAWL
jgi:hypothetical protein